MNKIKIYYQPLVDLNHYLADYATVREQYHNGEPCTLLVLAVDDYNFPSSFKPLAVSDRIWRTEAPTKVKDELLNRASLTAKLQSVTTTESH